MENYKYRKFINNKLNSIIFNQLEKTKENLGVNFDIENVYIYGSCLSEKDDPNDIDVFIKIENLNSEYADDFHFDPESDISEKEQFELYLLDNISDFLHNGYPSLNKQEVLNEKKIDINVQLKSFKELNYTGNYCDLIKFLKNNKKEKKIYYHGTNKNFENFKQRKGLISNVLGSEEVERVGFFFTDDILFAEEFGKVSKYHLNINKILDLRNGFNEKNIDIFIKNGFNEKYLINMQTENYWELFDEDTGVLFKKLIENNNYDAVLFKELDKNKKFVDVTVIFDSNKIEKIKNTKKLKRL